MTGAAGGGAPLVVGRGLVKRYGAMTALGGVDLDLPSGALAVVTGPSGSGKTTLLHVLSGIAAPDEGSVVVAGHALGAGEARLADLRRDLMGFVFQRASLLPALTVGENVAVPLLLRGVPRDAVRERVVEVLEQVGLPGRGPAWPAELSGGEAQRVAVARALAGRPQVVWADEPTGSLDSVAARGVTDLLRELVDAGSTVVVVTHDASVAACADVEVRLRDGRREA